MYIGVITLLGAFYPDIWEDDSHFDLRKFFKRVGKKPPSSYPLWASKGQSFMGGMMLSSYGKWHQLSNLLTSPPSKKNVMVFLCFPFFPVEKEKCVVFWK